MAPVRFADVTKRYDGGQEAIAELNLDIADGELAVLVGPSGSGKSTALRMLAGLEEISAGEVWIGDRVVNDLAPGDRDVAMVFQNYALYPHMTVRENMGFALKLAKMPKAQSELKVREAAATLELEELLDRKPAQLSGGQRQRVAMGRAIVREPQAFLMDEPLSNLDAKLRVSMRAELVSLHARLGATTVYVTHDQIEAMTLGQRVAVMRDGKIQQVDTPQTLYHFPENLYVAAFIGSPAMNLVEAEVEDEAVSFGGYRIPLPVALRGSLQEGRVFLGARPEAFEDAAFADSSLPQIAVDVTIVEELGSDTHVIFPVDAPRVETDELRDAAVGQEAMLLAEDRAVFNARVDPRTDASRGRPLRVAVDPERFYFFDPATGENLQRTQQPQSPATKNSHLPSLRIPTRQPR